MAQYSRAEAATRAGVDPSYSDSLIELAILTTHVPDELTKGDVLRAQMAHTLETAGIPLEGLAATIRDGRLSLS